MVETISLEIDKCKSKNAASVSEVLAFYLVGALNGILTNHIIKITLLNQDIKGDTAKIRTHQKIKLTTGGKEIQQVNPSGPDNSQGITPLPSHQLISPF